MQAARRFQRGFHRVNLRHPTVARVAHHERLAVAAQVEIESNI